MIHRHVVSCTAVALIGSGGTTAVFAAPFPVGDQNPLLAGFGLPASVSARAPQEAWSTAATFSWGSTALAQQAGSESLLVDVETRELRLALEWRLTSRASLQVQLPYRYMGGGNLDSFIDNWHDVFGLPEGARPLLPKNQMQIGYSRPGTQLWLDAPMEGLGDATLNLGYELYASDTSALRGVLGVKLPTGDTHVLNSSGATDISAIVAAEHRLAVQWHAYAQVAATWIGEGDLLPAQQRDAVWSGQIGVGWQATRAIELKVQLDGHTRVFDDSDLTFFGDALILTVGGAYTFRSGWTLDLGVSEDIEVEASPDVVFVIGLSKARRNR